MEWIQILYKSIPVFWWISVWGITETIIEWLVAHKKEWRIVFYLGMFSIILGILYFDEQAVNMF
jgi:hypothetical protein